MRAVLPLIIMNL